jgi:hypothetical protein
MPKFGLEMGIPLRGIHSFGVEFTHSPGVERLVSAQNGMASAMLNAGHETGRFQSDRGALDID